MTLSIPKLSDGARELGAEIGAGRDGLVKSAKTWKLISDRSSEIPFRPGSDSYLDFCSEVILMFEIHVFRCLFQVNSRSQNVKFNQSLGWIPEFFRILILNLKMTTRAKKIEIGLIL